jgi:hypothetical protein
MKERVWEELEELSLMMNEVVRDVLEREAWLNASLERNQLDRGQKRGDLRARKCLALIGLKISTGFLYVRIIGLISEVSRAISHFSPSEINIPKMTRKTGFKT